MDAFFRGISKWLAKRSRGVLIAISLILVGIVAYFLSQQSAPQITIYNNSPTIHTVQHSSDTNTDSFQVPTSIPISTPTPEITTPVPTTPAPTTNPTPVIKQNPFSEKKAQLHIFTNPQTGGETISIYTGPGLNYAQSESIKPAAQYTATILFIENNMAFTHLYHKPTNYNRFVYIDITPKPNNKYTNFDNINISYTYISSLDGIVGVVKEKVTPRWGPGNGYNECPEYTAIVGTTVNVFFQDSGYYYTEYNIGSELIRAWLPIDSISFV